MNANEIARTITAPVVVLVGNIICFAGYRIVKLTLAIMGFMAAAGAGWTFGSSVAPNNNAVPLVCAIVAGLIGAFLCVWFFFLGIFLLGAGAGAIVAEALFNASGNQPQPILVLVCAGVFGVMALVMQKFMIIVSTAFSGSYLIVAGILLLLTHSQIQSLPWFDRLHTGSSGAMSYVALAAWVALGLAGLSVQYRASRKEEPIRKEEKPR
ncbi:MAG TPA: DUF4203 domain-containing protein [Patescibacteria group bacterium]|jgi:hypothetical protein|nr:DUF4203 domain-containing protein [Patescibacteria group bacterium]